MDLGLLLGTGWASGVNLYAVVALLGLTDRMGWFEAPEILTNPVVIGLAVAMYAVEFVADKVPFLDNAWDVAHTFIRPVGAALVGAALAGQEIDASLLSELTAGAGSGALAFASHATKATARLAINTSPEPFTNIAASIAEDSLVAAVVLLAINNPLLAGIAVVLLLILGAVAMVALWKVAITVRQKVRARRGGTSMRRVSGRPID